ncbi:LysR family transcriptional regulator [Aliikangiella sp. G2MR2-5]|uniref:LysR family transcriptional regulator n=1 Tax=Aliikangiella sp. G2MR2-5 TaxID=2788943 RepID=UPI0018AADFAA|nr:LysR family transcriptional regulator [Aliikangiella sp. G2MR2-5]
MNPLEEMQNFVRIVEAGSITRAAEQQNTVKSAVSRKLADLEKRLGVTLLTRTTRRQTLTDTGRSYYQQCIRIIGELEEVEAEVRNENCALAGKIKVAAPLSFGLMHLSQAIRKFNEINPEIYFELDFNDRKVDIVEEGFDLAIRIARLEDSSLVARKLIHARTLLCASPAYLQEFGEPQMPEDLKKGHVKLKYATNNDYWQFKGENGEVVRIKVPAVISANNGEFLCQAAIEGKGLLFSPDFICYKAVRSGLLKPILCEYLLDNEISGYALYPQNRHLSRRVRSLIDFLAQYFGEKPYWSCL